MLVADTYVGNAGEDPSLRDRLDDEDAHTVTLTDTERRRSRVRTRAADGTELGVVVGRVLRDGDVVAGDDALVRVSLEPTTALAVDLAGADGDATALTTAVELGHAVGNRHWDLAVDDGTVYVPVDADPDSVRDEVRPHLPAGASTSVTEVPPSHFDDGGDGRERGHGHSHGTGHSHSHEGNHGHGLGGDHDHADHASAGVRQIGGENDE